jgi:VanZ family protein
MLVVHRRPTRYWLTAFTCAASLLVCFVNIEEGPEMPFTFTDKLIHAVMFLGIGGVVYVENTHYFKQKTSLTKLFAGTLLFPTVFGGLIELGQAQTNYRSGDVVDFLFNALGAVLALLIAAAVNPWLKKPL